MEADKELDKILKEAYAYKLPDLTGREKTEAKAALIAWRNRAVKAELETGQRAGVKANEWIDDRLAELGGKNAT